MFAQSVLFFFTMYVVSIILTMSCSDWFLIWIGLEINMMSFLVIIYSRSMISVETCMKYFFIQSLGSGVLMMMFYSEFSWFEYITLGVLSYKMGGGPFFFWFPPVCENISWGSCLLLMTVQKVLPLLVITLVVSMFLWMIIWSSIVMGAIGSMNQKSMKRLMAYSSIHHIGWMLMGNFISNEMWLIYLMIYSFMVVGIIMSLEKNKILEVGMLKGMSSNWSFSLGMLSMGGMPPLLGFYLKWWMFYNLMLVDYSLLMLMILMSVLMFYVYLRVVYNVILGSSNFIGWKMMEEKYKYLSMDMLYLMGLNFGVFLWMML